VSLRIRGLVVVVLSVIGIIVNIIDAVDDGFSVWNGIGIACFVVVLAYGAKYMANWPSRTS
jgi:hypothetical protein